MYLSILPNVEGFLLKTDRHAFKSERIPLIRSTVFKVTEVDIFIVRYEKSHIGKKMFKNFYVFWDVESTSKVPTEDAIISIGAVLCTFDERKFKKIREFHTFVATRRKIDAIAQSIHHISKRDLMHAPSFKDAITMFKTWILDHTSWDRNNSRVILMAHNGSRFDDVILFCNFVQNKLDFDEFLEDIHCYGFVDTLKMLNTLFKKKPKSKAPKDANTERVSFMLGTCYQSFCGGDVLENAHNALADSQALFEIYNSECVLPMLNLLTIFKFVTPKHKAVQQVKQTAGIRFQRKSEFTRMEKFKEANKREDEKDTVVKYYRTVDSCPSVWEDASVYDKKTQTSNRLCLQCMSFYILGTHEMCSVDFFFKNF
jgi:hypothetical protein